MSALIVTLLAAVLITSSISGILGMGGGMLLMGVYGLLLPITTAMILHGVTQMAANGFRTVLFRRHIQYAVLGPYLAGGLLCMLTFQGITLVPDRAVVFVTLGLLPFVSRLVPPTTWLDLERPLGGFLCGLAVTAAHLLAGVSGPLLDVFLLRSRMNRHGIIGTKALTQTFGHGFKLVYYGGLVTGAGGIEGLPAWVLPLVVLTSFAGTTLGKQVVARLSEARFRRIANRVLLLLGVAYLWRGIGELVR